MVQVLQLTVLDADGNPVDVATLTALVALFGDTTANPPANTLLDRVKAISTALGASFAHDVTATITRQANTTPYDAGDVVGPALAKLTFANVGKAGGSALINGVSLKLRTGTLPATAWRLHLYSVTPPSDLADAATFAVSSGDRDAYLGWIDIPAAVNLGSTCVINVNNIGMQVKLSSANLYGYLQAIAGYTPGSGDVYDVTVHTAEV